jgi:hypothetical protein
MKVEYLDCQKDFLLAATKDIQSVDSKAVMMDAMLANSTELLKDMPRAIPLAS